MTNETNSQMVHVFERAGLGKAPFALVNIVERRGPIRVMDASGIELMVGAPGQPMGTCDFCGIGIADCFVIESSDGKRFEVGCDCVAKTYDRGLVKAVKQAKSAAKKQADAVRIARTLERLRTDEALRAKLQTVGHQNEHMAKRGLTALDCVEWLLEHAGNSGKIRACRLVDRYAREMEQ